MSLSRQAIAALSLPELVALAHQWLGNSYIVQELVQRLDTERTINESWISLVRDAGPELSPDDLRAASSYYATRVESFRRGLRAGAAANDSAGAAPLARRE